MTVLSLSQICLQLRQRILSQRAVRVTSEHFPPSVALIALDVQGTLWAMLGGRLTCSGCCQPCACLVPWLKPHLLECRHQP